MNATHLYDPSLKIKKTSQDDLIKLQYTTVTQVGWDIEDSSKLGEKLLRGATTTEDLG